MPADARPGYAELRRPPAAWPDAPPRPPVVRPLRAPAGYAPGPLYAFADD